MKSNYLAIAALAIALVACDKNDDLVIDNTKDTPITILSAGVADLSTRAITDDGELVGTSDEYVSIGACITGGSKYNYYNHKCTHNGTSWFGAMLYEGSGSNQQIYAYYPYNAAEEDYDDSFTVTADGTTDYLVAKPTKIESSTVTLTMTHALAKLVLNKPTFGKEITNMNISKVVVGGMYASGTWTFKSNTWSDLSETPDATFDITDDYEVLVIPMEGCTSFPITITMEDNRVFKASIPCPEIDKDDSGNSIYGLAAGTQYNISLQIGQDFVILDGITASTWTSADGGALETE